MVQNNLSIAPNLLNIIPYHPASQVFWQDEPKKPFSKSVQIKVLFHEIDGLLVEHPNYKYQDIINNIVGNDQHTNNLLVLIQNLIEIEGSHYSSYTLSDLKGVPNLNLHLEIITILKDIIVINSMLELGDMSDVQNKVKAREKGIDIKGMMVEIHRPEEKLQILHLMKGNRIALLQDYTYPIMSYFKGTDGLKVEDLHNIGSDKIQEVIDRLEQSFKDKDNEPQKLFLALVVKTITEYLKEEIVWPRPKELTDEKCSIIHTLLCIFGLIDYSNAVILIHKREKAEYIRTLARIRDTKYPERRKILESFRLVASIPVNKLSDYPDLTL